MTHTITIQTKSSDDFDLLKGLAQRLGLPLIEKHEEKTVDFPGEEFLKLQKKYPPRIVAKDINISSVADEINV